MDIQAGTAGTELPHRQAGGQAPAVAAMLVVGGKGGMCAEGVCLMRRLEGVCMVRAVSLQRGVHLTLLVDYLFACSHHYH